MASVVCTFVLCFLSLCTELKQVEDLFVRYCGSASGLMNVEQFSLLLVHLGFVPELCQQCYG